MTLMPRMFFIVCPLLFLAGFVDSIGGGGGLISLPAYLFAGLPVHAAVATNKLSSACGTSVVTARFIKNGLVNFRVVLPGVAAAMLGSASTARPFTTPSLWSAGVEDALASVVTPSAATQTTSVKVPPTSTPMR